MLFFCRILVFILLSFTATCVLAQPYHLTGTVTESGTAAPLAFVNVVANNGVTGTNTDIDGRFTLVSKEPINQLSFSYVGYETKTIVIAGSSQPLKVELTVAVTRLAEVQVKPGENPAQRIIKLATASRDKNNPENLPAFRYTSYNKLIITAQPAKANMADTMSLVTRADTAEYEVRKLMEKQHLFVMETITRRNFMAPALSKEVVLASRMSGFKQARFAFLASDLQPFSMYNDFILLSGRSYLNPLSQGSTRKFNFLIEDTTYTGTDTVFVISFSPAKGKNFEALKGLLYINSDGWALQNIIAQPVEGDLKGMRIQQMYEKPDGEHWFPVQLNTDFVIPNVELGGHLPTAISRSYITNIDLNPQLRRRDFDAVAVEIEPMAHARENGFWQQHRSDSLDLREEKTYQVLDSLGEENNFDKKLKIFESLISGRYPLGYVDFDVTRLLDVNRYEGVRLGAGLYTSERVSKFFTVGGYGAYGFRDKGFKYGADGTFFLYRPLSLELKVTWFEDIKESGGTFLPFKRRGIVSNELRHLVLDNMDKTKHQSAFISFRTLKFLQLTTGLRHEYKRTTNGYQFETQPDQWNSKFRFTEGIVGMRYAFREKLAKTGNRLVELGSNYPVLWLQYTRGLRGPNNGQFAYNKYDARIETSFRTKTFGLTQIEVAGGITEGELPFTNLYNGHGSFSKKVRIYASEGFETMAPGEFANDRYAALYLKHTFGKLLFRSKHFSPSLSVVTNIGFGELQSPGRHRIATENGFGSLQAMNKGYYESGIILNELVKSNFSAFGFGIFSRFGPYQKAAVLDNLTAKISFSYTF